MKPVVILIGHGSKMPGFDAPMKKVAARLRQSGLYGAVSCAYLEVTQPSIENSIKKHVNLGFGKIYLLPYFVLLGMHVKKDIPQIARRAALQYRSLARIVLCPYLGYDDSIVALIKKRLQNK